MTYQAYSCWCDTFKPVKPTWLNSIKARNYESWTGLTYYNVAKYFPLAEKTIKWHLVQMRKGMSSTKSKFNVNPKSKPSVTIASINGVQPLPCVQSNEMETTRNLYSDDTGRLPINLRR